MTAQVRPPRITCSDGEERISQLLRVPRISHVLDFPECQLGKLPGTTAEDV